MVKKYRSPKKSWEKPIKMRLIPRNPGLHLTRCAPSPESWKKFHKMRPIPGKSWTAPHNVPRSRKAWKKPHKMRPIPGKSWKKSHKMIHSLFLFVGWLLLGCWLLLGSDKLYRGALRGQKTRPLQKVQTIAYFSRQTCWFNPVLVDLTHGGCNWMQRVMLS